MTLGLGYAEIAIILVFALIVVGPKRLPKLMRDFGRIMGQLRRTSDELRREILFSDEITDFKRTVRDAVDPAGPPPVPPRIKVKKKDPGAGLGAGGDEGPMSSEAAASASEEAESADGIGVAPPPDDEGPAPGGGGPPT